MSKRQRIEDDDSSSDGVSQEDNSSKYLHIDESSQATESKPIIHCSLAPHAKAIPFQSYDDYEKHYLQDHSNRCSECNKNFPTQHFLYLHISENHDPINKARRAKGEETYACFVEGCDKVCLEPRRRRMHLIDKHMFPKNYDFFIVNNGLDPSRRGSMLRPEYGGKPRSVPEVSMTFSATTSDRAGVGKDMSEARQHPAPSGHSHMKPPAQTVQKEDVDTLTNSMSALKFVPSSVRFGRHGRGGFFKQ